MLSFFSIYDSMSLAFLISDLRDGFIILHSCILFFILIYFFVGFVLRMVIASQYHQVFFNMKNNCDLNDTSIMEMDNFILPNLNCDYNVAVNVSLLNFMTNPSIHPSAIHHSPISLSITKLFLFFFQYQTMKYRRFCCLHYYQ